MQGMSFWALAIVALLSTGFSSQADVPLDCQPGWTLMGVQCYKIYETVKPWESAAKICKDYGSELAKVTDFYENQEIGNFANGQNVDKFWIGFTRTEAPAGDQIIGYWSDGQETVTAVGFWENDQPNDDLGKCVYIMKKDGRFYWSFGPCEAKRPYVCQRPACPSGSHHCVNGRCINPQIRCDGEDDCGDLSDEMNCPSQCSQYLQQNSGTIMSNNFPNNYPDAMNCRWTIQVPLGQNAYIRFTNFSTENNVDVVQVFVGGSTEERSELVGMHSGSISESLPEYTSTNNFIIVKFSSDIAINNMGFKADFSGKSDNMPLMVSLTAKDTPEVLSAPNYPNMYLGWQDYTWVITTDRQTQIITLKVDDLDLKGSDEILVRDGPSVDSNLIYRYTTDTHVAYVPYLFSTGNSLYIYLNTRGYDTGRGFSFTYRQGCHMMLSSISGHIFSPGYKLSDDYEAMHYPNLLDCAYIVDIPSRPKLTLQYKDYKTQQNNDVITVNHGGVGSPAVMSGAITAVTTQTVNGQFNVTFTTDAIQRDKGFSFLYSIDCPVPTFNDKTIVPANVPLQFRSSFEVRCMPGYHFTSQEYQDKTVTPQFVSREVVRMECMANGKWSHDTTPVCKPQYCGPAPLVANAYVNSSSGQASSFGGLVNYACYPGFTMLGSGDVRCRSDGTWERTPNCTIASCSPVTTSIANGVGSITVGDGTEFGSIINYTCNPGYQVSGQPIIFCSSDSTWTAAVPSCIRKNCPIPFVANGNLSPPGALAFYGDPRSLICDGPGYQRVAARTTFSCGPDHLFENLDELKCEDRNECNDPTACAHNCTNTEGSFMCSCRDGFVLSGNNRTCDDIRECSVNNGGCSQNCIEQSGSYACSCNNGFELFTTNGQLNYTIPTTENGNGEMDVYRFQHTCVRIQCMDPPTLANGHILTKRTYHRFQDYITMSCDIGFVLNGPSFRVCQANGQWSDVDPVCSPAQCQPDPLPGGLMTTPTVTPSGSVGYKEEVTITCNTPGKSEFVKNRQCLLDPITKNYALFGAEYECGVIDCGQPMGVPGANLPNLARTVFGETFTFQCNNLYTLQGVSSSNDRNVACKNNGYWGWGTLRCEGLTCTDPGRPVDGAQIATSYEEGKMVNFTCDRPGYTIRGNSAIKCVVNPAGNALGWDGAVPTCEDTEKPTFDNCITEVTVQRYISSTIAVTPPTARDNTGIKSMSAMPAWPTSSLVISGDVLFNFTAVDYNGNSETCLVNVRVKEDEVKDEVPPNIVCPGPRQERFRTITDSRTLVFNAAADGVFATDDSGIAPTITFRPASIVLSAAMIGQANYRNWIYVEAKDASNNTNRCRFQIVVSADTCSPMSLPTPVHGQKSCASLAQDSGFTCNLTCDAGFAFRNQPMESISTSCLNGNNFNLANPVPACSVLDQIPSYNQQFRIDYEAGTSGTLTTACAADFAATLQEVMSDIESDLTGSCSFIQLTPTVEFRAINPITDIVIDVPTRRVSVNFTLVYTTSNPQATSLETCANVIGLLIATTDFIAIQKLSGQSTPIRPQSCPQLRAPTGKGIVQDTGFQCFNGQELKNIDNNRYCLNCPQGTFINPITMNCELCPLGTYSQSEGANSCTDCGPGTWTESRGATNGNMCKSVCDQGSTSSTRLPPCTDCPLNSFWVNSTSCQNCPTFEITRSVGSIASTDCKAPCPAGEYNSVDGHQNCRPCPLNFYQSQTGQASCVQCGGTQVTANVGSTTPSNCIDGSANCAGFCLKGQCSTVMHSSSCTCPDGYFGEKCENEIDPCFSAPCYNNGVCVRGSADTRTYTCQCQQGTTGLRCETDLNNCTATSCLNGGMCQDHPDGITCLCKQGFTGATCANLQDICIAQPCNNGTCSPIGTFRRECACFPGFSGKDCEININECASNPCQHGGTCEDRINSYMCKCQSGFTGTRCDVRIGKCNGVSCGGGLGMCIEDHIDNTYRCVCNEGYSFGEYCDYVPRVNHRLELMTASVNTTQDSIAACKRLCENTAGCESFSYNMANNECLLHVTRTGILPVVPQSGSYYFVKQCKKIRDDFYTEWFNASDPAIPAGNYITLDYLRNTLQLSVCGGTEPLMVECRDAQTKGPSSNVGVTCTPTEGFKCDNNNQGVGRTCRQHEVRFKCAASRVFTENECKIENHCQSSPCVHGTCIDTGLTYVCDCSPGYGGSMCQNNLDDCASNPCQNQGTCTDGENMFSCECAEGFDGPTCATPINYCGTQPCNATGSINCTNTHSGAVCYCKPGYKNQFCSQNIQECDSNPCYNGGDCIDGIGTYTCNCKQGWTGERCEYLVKECDPNSPCENGADCHNLFGNYFCKCKANTYGLNCENAPSVCANANPCVHGQCTEDSGVTSCSCGQNFTGSGCEIQVQHCGPNSQTCQNGGKCSVTSLDNYQCSCPEGFSGVNCETNQDNCNVFRICPITSTCVDGVNEHFCRCPIGKTGENCTRALDRNYDMLFESPKKVGYAYVPYPILVRSNKFSLSLWVRYWNKDGKGTFFSMFTVNNRNSLAGKKELISIDESGLSIAINGTMVKIPPPSTIKYNDGKWYQISVTWNGETGDLRFVVNTISNTIINYATGMSLDTYCWIMLGAKYDVMKEQPIMYEGFNGWLSQLSLHARDLVFETEIPLKLENPQTIIPNEIFAWNEFRRTGGVTIKIPSSASSNSCPRGFSGPGCQTPNQRKQVVYPKMCPTDQVMLGQTRITKVVWNDPEFDGSVVSVESTHKSGQVFGWDRYLVVYVATNAAGNKGLCSFKVFVQYTDCPKPADPYRGLTLERRASSPLITSAIQCNVGYASVRPVPALYTCPRIGHYNPPMKYNSFKLPPCGQIISNPLREVVMKLLYQISSVFCAGIQNSMATKFRNAIISLNSRWGNGLCQSFDCSDVIIQVGCTGNVAGATGRRKRQTVNEVFANVTLPQANAQVSDGTQTLSPDDVLRLAALNLGSFDFSRDIPNAKPLDDLTTVTSTLSCETGQAVVGGQCVKCAPGTFYNALTMVCDDCPIGQYQDNEGASSCIPCVSKITELPGASSITDCKDVCPIGQFFNESTSMCNFCPIGFYQNQTGQFFCHPCSVEKTTRNEGSASINDCYVGCSVGEQLGSAGTCEKCPIGKFRDASMPICGDCPGNLTTTVEGADDLSKCNVGNCLAGYFRDSTNQSICKPCPIGTYQNLDQQYSCRDCGTTPYDVTFNEASKSVSQCVFVCPDGNERTLLAGQQTCVPCKIGYFRNSTRTPLTPCLPCNDGTTTPTIGSDSQLKCTVLQCPVGQQPKADNSMCEQCPLGTYQDVANEPNCKACTGQTSTRVSGASSNTQCEYFCLGGQEKQSDGSCRLCPVGFFKDNSVDKFMNCTKCPDINTVTATVGADSAAKCTVRSCSPGYKRTADDSACEPCPIGFYQPLPFQSTCLPCQGPTSTRQNATVNSTQCERYCPSGQEKNAAGLCVPCPRGFFKDNSNGLFEQCQMCDVNTITASTGATSVADCNVANCSAGYRIDANTNACIECGIGFYQPEKWQTTCEQCPTDKTTTAIKSTSAADCILSCPPGKEDVGGNCSLCKRGYYKEQEVADLCTECDTNTTTTGQGSTRKSDCNVVGCPAGYKSISSTDCEACPYGFYQPERWQSDCRQCDSGTTTHVRGATSTDSCVLDCAAGKQYNSDTMSCEDCPRGFYQDKANARFPMCIICGDPARITASTGATSASLCTIQNCTTPGQFRNSTTNLCQDCAMGTYQDTKWEETCKTCAPGFTTRTTKSPSSSSCVRSCELGKQQVGDSCVDCGIGKYRDGTTWECQDCPNGLSTTSLTAASVLECNVSPCTAGSYFDRAAGSCRSCPVNTYQPSGSSFDCESCPSGKFTNTVGNRASTDCKGFCDTPDVCPANSDCTEDPDTKFKCSCKADYVDEAGVCVHKCDTDYCMHGSTCLRSTGSAYCACAEFYKGDRCDIRRNAEEVSAQNQVTIVGIVVGILGFLLLLILLAVCLFRRRRVPEKRTPSDYDDRTSLARGPYDYPLAYVSKPASVVSGPRYMLPQTVEKSYDNQLYIASDDDPAVYKA